MKIEMGQNYCLRNGNKYRMLADDGGGNYPIIGLFRAEPWSPWAMIRHTREGVCHITGNPSDLDLVSPSSLIPINRQFWMNVYPDSYFVNGVVAIGYTTRAQADEATSRHGRIACIDHRIQFRDGDGL